MRLGRTENYATLFNEYTDTGVLEKSRQYAKWTIPSLMAKSSLGQDQVAMMGDFQSKGATLVNSLASKLTSLLFPTTHAFMGFKLDKEILGMIGVEAADLDEELSRTVYEASQQIFLGKAYHQLNMAIKHLIVTGNVCIKRDSEKNLITAYGLERYAVKRDGDGNVLDAVIREQVYLHALPSDIQATIRKEGIQPTDLALKKNLPVDMYTRIEREDIKSFQDIPMYKTSVMINGVKLGEEYEGRYTENELPYVFAVWNLVAGENYGRGHCEDYAGGLANISELSYSLALYSIESLHVTNLVGSGSASSIDDLAQAPMGGYVRANPDEVRAHETGSSAKVEFIRAEIETEFSILAEAFMYRGNTRDAERVTAFEISQQIKEVESAMGGAYSSLAESLQLPLSYILLYEVNKELMQLMADGLGSVEIITGVNALGKSTEIQNLISAMQEAHAIVSMVREIDPRVDTTKVMDEVYKSYAIESDKYLKTEQELEQEAMAMQEQQQGQQEMQQAMAMTQDMQGGM